MIHLGDCLTVMRTMPSESIDSVVTDPPAAVSFMGKKWDHNKGGRTQWVAWMTEVMQECYRLLKPGAWIVVWSLPRTCHWTGWAIEDAGFRITDQLAHVFASGFPKGKAQLKPAREDWWLARKPGPLRPLAIDACRIGFADGHGGGANGTSGFAEGYEKGDGFSASQVGRWPSNLLLSDPALFDEPNPEVVGSGQDSIGSGNRLVKGGSAGNTWGVGDDTKKPRAIERDYAGDTGGYSRFFKVPHRHDWWCEDDSGRCVMDEDEEESDPPPQKPTGEGRTPAERGDYPKAFIIPKADRADREPVLRGQLPLGDRVLNSGSSGRTQIDGEWVETHSVPRQRENAHPTVKPVDLMRHLVRLVTPSRNEDGEPGLVLDPFLGSGSTAIACEMEGFPWIGIEKEVEYTKIAEARLNGVQKGMGLDVPAPTINRAARPRESEGRDLSSNRQDELIWKSYTPEEVA